jgi:hypothetical protein
MPEIHIDDHHVGTEYGDAREGLNTVFGNADDLDTLAFQQIPGDLQELGVIINDEAAQRHTLNFSGEALAHIEASWNWGHSTSFRWPGDMDPRTGIHANSRGGDSSKGRTLSPPPRL